MSVKRARPLQLNLSIKIFKIFNFLGIKSTVFASFLSFLNIRKRVDII